MIIINYIIYDLEFNQKSLDVKDIENDITSKMPFEIIQIGALKLNENFETISTFNTLINPTLYKTIHPFVEDLTKITTEQVSSYDCFPSAYKNFTNFIGNDETILCVWGLADIKELIKNVKFHNLSASLLSDKYIDIQDYTSKYFNAPKGTRISLRNAVEFLNITTNSEFHNAFNDAFYTAEVFKKIYNDSIIPKVYTPSPSKRTYDPKGKVRKVNTTALINQFEKMYNRNMTEEEKSIIKTAYMMGKTNQFTT